MLNQLAIALSSAVILTAGIAHASTIPQSAANREPYLVVQVEECVTEVEDFPTDHNQVVYVTEATACFDVVEEINIAGELYPIQYEAATGYYYVIYANVPWYFVDWDGTTLLTDGYDYMEVYFPE